LQLTQHKKIFRKYIPYPIQSYRLKSPSYYKIHKQLFIYWKKNYLSKNFTRTKLANITKKINHLKKEKLINFVSNIELTLNCLLLRMRLLNSTGIVHQFIKHGNIFINYNKIVSPAYLIKPGDTISIYINSYKQKYHRFHDPLYTSYFMHGLYRKHSGRQSLITYEKMSELIKMSLNTFNL
jgi:ribosomal protein S4